jgi:hypothetical protein
MSTQTCQFEAAGRTLTADFVPAIGEAGMWTFNLDGIEVRVAPPAADAVADTLAMTAEVLLAEPEEVPDGP